MDRVRDTSCRCILFEPSQRVMPSQEKTVQMQLKLSECHALMNHDRGHWEHKHSNELLLSDTSSFVNKTYLPIEVEWICEGQRISTNFLGIMPR